MQDEALVKLIWTDELLQDVGGTGWWVVGDEFLFRMVDAFIHSILVKYGDDDDGDGDGDDAGDDDDDDDDDGGVGNVIIICLYIYIYAIMQNTW